MNPNPEILALTADVSAAFLRTNAIDPARVPGLISSVYGALSALGQPEVVEAPKQEPAVSVRGSVTPDLVVCMECGAKAKMLKRHLMAAHGLTAEAYRAKWGLKPDHALTAPNYSARRTELAKSIGLGRKAVAE